MLTITVRAQFQYARVTHTSGVKTVAGINVNVTKTGNATAYVLTQPICTVPMSYIVGHGGSSGLVGPGSFSYAFSPAVDAAKIYLTGIETFDSLSIYMNGALIDLSAIGNYPGCTVTLASYNQPYLHGTGNDQKGYISLIPSMPIDSIRFQYHTQQPSINAAGIGYTLEFMYPDTVVALRQPYTDTLLCFGDTATIGWDVSYRFKPNNIFDIQLSDAMGSFNSFTTIASIPSDTSGSYKWGITPMPVGGNYRVRIVASNPRDTSDDNLKDIKIGETPAHPIIQATNPVCFGAPIELTANSATPNVSYEWIGAQASQFSFSPFFAVTPSATFNDSGNYIVKTILYDCFVRDTVRMIVKQSPGTSITASTNGAICAGDSLKLSATNTNAGTVYSWKGPNGYIGSGQNTGFNTGDSSASGDYVVTATLNNCSIKDTVTAAVKPLPVTLVPFNNGPLCETDTLHLSVNGVFSTTFSWTGPDTFSSQLRDPILGGVKLAHTGVFRVTATRNGCIRKDSTTVLIKPLPGKPEAGSNTPLCVGDSIKLTATNTTTGVVFNWTGPVNFQANNIANPYIKNAGISRSGDYIVTADLNGCMRYDTTSIMVFPNPQPTADTVADLCAGETIHLRSADTTTGVSFTWTGPNYTATGNNQDITNAQVANSGQYIIISTISTCSRMDTVDVLVKPMPDATEATNNTPLCSGETLKIFAANGTPGLSFTWSGPEGFSSADQNPFIDSVTTIATGIYKVVADLNGCKTEDTTLVTIKPTPRPNALANSPLNIGRQLELRALNHIAGTSYYWEGPGGFTSLAQNPFITKVSAAYNGIYKVTATLNGCVNSDTVSVVINDVADTGKVFMYPNPNNGNFTIAGLLHRDQRIFYEVLNAAGQSIYAHYADTDKKLFSSLVTMPYAEEGPYMIRIRADGKVFVFRFIIQRDY